MRENRPYGSEGGVGENRSLPLSAEAPPTGPQMAPQGLERIESAPGKWRERRDVTALRPPYICRSSIMPLICAIALAGLRPFGQVFAQFMIVWQR